MRALLRFFLTALVASTLGSQALGQVPEWQVWAQDKFYYGRDDGLWGVACSGGRRDALGEIKQAKYCVLMRGSVITAPLLVARTDGISVVGRGLHSRPCEFIPKKYSVDQRRIDTLPAEKQVATVLAGGMFAREAQEPWPYCYPKINTISLEGIDKGHALLKAVWREFKARD